MLAVTARRPAVRFSPRELEVLELLRVGYTVKEIARRLELSEWTVRGYVVSARLRIGARTTAQLLALYARTREDPRSA